MRRMTFILWVLLALTACTRRVYVPQREVVTERAIIRDTALVVEADSAALQALLECDSAGQVLVREIVALRAGKHLLAPQVLIRQNMLTVSAEVDSFAIYAQLRDRYVSTTTTETVVINELTDWQRLQISGFWILLSIAVVSRAVRRLG